VRRYSRTLWAKVTDTVAQGNRSSVYWKIGRELRERGATPGEVACVLGASRCWQDKHGRNNHAALHAEVRRIFSKPQ
jgi:hypothetical protein